MRRLGKRKVKLGKVWIVYRTDRPQVCNEGYVRERDAQEEVDVLNALEPGAYVFKQVYFVK